MNTRQKGRRLVTWLRDYFKSIDRGVYEIVGSGSGLEKGDLRLPGFNLVIEAKNQQTLSIRKDVLQAKKQSLNINEYALVFRHPESPESNPDCYAVLHVDYFFKLLKYQRDHKSTGEILDRYRLRDQLKSALMHINKRPEMAKQYIREIIKNV